MAIPVTRQLVQDYFSARVSRDPARLAQMLDDHVEWSISGPVELMHFCGERHGKQAAIDAIILQVPSQLEVTGLHLEEILIEGDRAATFSRLVAKHAQTGRSVSYHCAQFLQFRDGKVTRFRALIDSFDAVEQLLGHHIELTPDAVQVDEVVAV